MELILKSDVPNLGFKDDLVSVKNGYGRNYLIPQGLAVLATPSSKKVLAENIKQREFKELLKRNPSLYFTIQSVLSAQVSDKLVISSKK